VTPEQLTTVQEIEARRRMFRVSKSELCREAGVHLQTYRRWVLHQRSPTVRTLSKVQSALARLTAFARVS
jgi:DNA-binding transcriptional regulator YiaG